MELTCSSKQEGDVERMSLKITSFTHSFTAYPHLVISLVIEWQFKKYYLLSFTLAWPVTPPP